MYFTSFWTTLYNIQYSTHINTAMVVPLQFFSVSCNVWKIILCNMFHMF